jgi:hypothetical protein
MLPTLSLYQPLQAPTLSDLLKHIDQMLKWQGEKCAMAAYNIYRICEHSHRHNRIHMLMTVEVTHQQASKEQPLHKKSKRYTLLSALCETLKRNIQYMDDIYKEGIQYACLALNILSIPAENKPIMGASEDVLKTLRGFFTNSSYCKGKEASFVCCICLLNLSLYEPNRRVILHLNRSDWAGGARDGTGMTLVAQAPTSPGHTSRASAAEPAQPKRRANLEFLREGIERTSLQPTSPFVVHTPR